MSQSAKDVVKLAKMLFEGAPEMESEASQRRIFNNYMKMRDELVKHEPKLTYRQNY